MNKIITLTKVLWKNISNKEANNKNKKNKIAYVLIVVYLFVMFGVLSYNLVQELNGIGQGTLFINLLLMSMFAMILFTGVFASINIFYFSKDIINLIPLPLKPKEIFISKLNTLLIYEYIVEAMIALPGFVMYGIVNGAGILYYIYSLIVMIVFPIVPTIISLLIIMIIMCFSNLIKYKEKFQMMVGFVAIIVAIGMQIGIQNFTKPDGNIDINLVVTQTEGLTNNANKYFITVNSATNAITEFRGINGFLNIIFLVLETAVAFVILILVGEKIFFKGLLGSIETGAVKRKNKKENKEKRLPVGRACVEKELKILFRNPVYFIQCVLPNILIPIVFIVMILIAGNGAGEVSVFVQSIAKDKNIVMLFSLGILQFVGSMNITTITAISRDARSTATYIKTFPINLYNQIKYKIAAGIILDWLSISITMFILKIFVDMAIDVYIVSIILAAIISVARNLFIILIDLKLPKLDWETEYAVVKQNMNVIFQMLLCMFIILALIALGICCASWNYLFIALLIFVLFAVFTILWNRYLSKNINRLYEKIS